MPLSSPSAPDATVTPAARRHLAVLFTDLAGSTRLGRRMEPEELAALMQALRGVWQAAAQAHGGRLVRAQGDGALLLFGVEATGEDDGRRAVEAALDIQARVQALEVPGLPPGERLQTHAGVHAGVLLVAPGDLARGELDLAGDVVNTAAHLAAAAPPGQVLASLAALGPHEHLFDAVPPDAPRAGLPPAALRLVAGRSALRGRYQATARRGLTPLVGRAAALAQLAGFIAGDPTAARCLVLQGEAGIGKTRLLHEALAQATAGVRVLHGTCEQQLDSQPLQPFAQMREQAGDAGAAGATGEGADGGAELRAWARSLAGREDLLLVVDDWQWADEASLQVVAALLARPRGPRLLLAMRPLAGVAPPPGARLLELQPLSAGETQAAVRRWLAAADPFLCQQIHRHSGGIPLYIEELCHCASVGELALALGGAGAPSWIAGLAAARLARLPASQVRLVQAAAVAGNEVALPLLERLLGRAPGPQELEAVERADFLYRLPGRPVLAFKHGVTREAVYAAIDLPLRRQLHASVLQALLAAGGGQPRPQDAEALAHHGLGAGHWAEAARQAELAGDRAMAALALDRARAHYVQALQAGERAGPADAAAIRQACLLTAKLGMCCVFDPVPLQGDTSRFEQALAQAGSLGDANLEARAGYWLAYVEYALGRFRQSRSHAAAALERARASGDERLAVQIEATQGQILAAMSDPAALPRIASAVGAKRDRQQARGSLAIGSAYALACQGALLADAGDFARAHDCFDESLDLVGGSPHPVGNSVRNWISVAHSWQGHWDAALQVGADSERIAQAVRALLLLASARGACGHAAWWGRAEPAGLARMEEAMHWMHARGAGFCTSIFDGWLALARSSQGDAAATRLHAARVLQRARAGELFGLAQAQRSLAWLAALQGDAARAARWLARAERAAQRRGSAREQALTAWARSRVAQRLGEPDRCAREAALARRGFERLDMRWHAAQAAAGVPHLLP